MRGNIECNNSYLMTNFITKKRGKDVLLFPSHHAKNNVLETKE